jgi:signal transduction histidine kinase
MEPMGTAETTALRRLLDVALALGAEHRTEPVLRTILDAARDLTDARYGAIGVPDGDGGFALFLTAGVDARTWERIGALPRTHGLLGALLTSPEVIRLDDIRTDPRFGRYPEGHPVMRSFLGVPIVAGGEVVAELYLADKVGAGRFTDFDQRLVETLAAHAALAVVNAQRNERTRELSIAEERNRLARDLHDSVTQTLFSLTLVAETAGTLAARGSDRQIAEQVDRIRALAREALDEMRALVETLRPPDPSREGLAVALRKRVELLRRVHDVPVTLDLTGPARLRERAVEREVLRVAGEALSNALRHAEASSVSVVLDTSGGGVWLVVDDDGRGFDLPATIRHSRRLGLVSLFERADALGGTLRVDTAPGRGTRVTLEVPGD